MRDLAKRAVLGTVGLLPFFDYRLKAVNAPETWRLKRLEDAEVARHRARLGDLPTAEFVTVIPTYRRPEALRAAVDSALSQTVQDHKVVVVDDGAGLPSLPESPALVAISLSRNTGVVGVVRNVGIRLSRSRYLAFLDDDNTWAPQHLATARRALEDGAGLVYTGLRRVDAAGAPVDVLAEPFHRAGLRERGFVDASTIVVRRDPRVRFSRTPRRFGSFPREDWEIAWRLSRRLPTVGLPDVTATYVVHDGSHFTDWQADDARAPG